MTTYYDYQEQKYKTDIKGFESFHIRELEFLTSDEAKKHYSDEMLRHNIRAHISQLESAGLTDNISDGFKSYL